MASAPPSGTNAAVTEAPKLISLNRLLKVHHFSGPLACAAALIDEGRLSA